MIEKTAVVDKFIGRAVLAWRRAFDRDELIDELTFQRDYARTLAHKHLARVGQLEARVRDLEALANKWSYLDDDNEEIVPPVDLAIAQRRR
jgi:hypothetical protein